MKQCTYNMKIIVKEAKQYSSIGTSDCNSQNKNKVSQFQNNNMKCFNNIFEHFIFITFLYR